MTAAERPATGATDADIEAARKTVDAFWAKVDLHGPVPAHRPELGNCYVWTAAKTGRGYGSFREWRAHKWLWEQTNGPVPEGLVLDHLCRNKVCVRPSHLEAVTNRTNVLRGDSLAIRIHNSGMCAKGHPMTGENAARRSSASAALRCRKCHREYGRTARIRNGARVLSEPRVCRGCGKSFMPKCGNQTCCSKQCWPSNRRQQTTQSTSTANQGGLR